MQIGIAGGKIVQVKPAALPRQDALNLQGCYAFPGLINSHDHLDYNLFPQLGHGPYANYLEWGPDIHRQDKEAIAAVLHIPKSLRIQWGLYKNLLNGITTVVQHGELPPVYHAPIRIHTQSYTLHSVGLERRWRYRLNRPFRKRRPFVIHIGEGTDDAARKEIDILIRNNYWRRELIGVHGVAMTEAQARHFKAVVWCPDSNQFLLNATAPVAVLKAHTNILFGTDATVSASWNMGQQLRAARALQLLPDEVLIESVTSTAAAVWKLKDTGKLLPGYMADIVVVKPETIPVHSADAFFSLDPATIQLVLHGGKPVLYDHSLALQMKPYEQGVYTPVQVGEQIKYVAGDLPALMREIRTWYPGCSFPVDPVNPNVSL